MTSRAPRFAIAVLGAVVFSVMPGGGPAVAQDSGSENCPCVSVDFVDSWFLRLGLSPEREKEMYACVDDPGFTAFDYFDRTAFRRAITST